MDDYNFPADDYALTILTQAAMQTHSSDASSSNTNNSLHQNQNNRNTSNSNIQNQQQRYGPATTLSSGATTGVTRDRGAISNHASGRDDHFSSLRDTNINHNQTGSRERTSELLDSGYSSAPTRTYAAMETLAYGRGHQSPYMNAGYHGIGAQISSNFANANAHGDLGILSAESYDDGRLAMSTRDARKSKVVEGGIGGVMPFGVQDGEARTDSDEFEKGTKGSRRRKRAEVVNVDEEEEARKKARGRPRVDTKDETAADVSAFVY